MDETKTPEPTPEQLLKLLDAQLAASRARRTQPRTQQRVAVLVGGVLLIVAGSCVALFILQQLLTDLPQPQAGEAPPAAVQPAE